MCAVYYKSDGSFSLVQNRNFFQQYPQVKQYDVSKQSVNYQQLVFPENN